MTNQNKYALLIGINKYSNLPPQYQLNGCINDIEMMASILEENFGFPESNITMLRDEEATREGILEAFWALTGRIAENDIAVIHYSGHGSQIRDREGDEPDGWDETIVPNDSGRGSYPNRDITDDEIYLWLLELTEKTPHITLIFDCCNSGTISRDAFGTKSRWVEPDMRPVEELPPSPVLEKMMKASSRDIGPSGWLPLSKRYVLIAGCRDNESSYEHMVHEGGKVSHGAMTYFLSRELTKAEPGATYRDIFERASVNVTTHYPYQHPQLEGARDRELFGISDNQPTHFISVRERAGDNITLGAGAAHGMTVHSKWAIYPQATKLITKDIQSLGLVEITQVNAVTSYARISKEVQNGIIKVNSRAVEEEHFYGQMRLKVEIRAPAKYVNDANRLSERIGRSALLSLVEAGETADVRAYIIASRTDVRSGDPVPQLKVVDKPVWAVVGQDGRLLMPIHDIDEASVVSILFDNLEKVARYRQAIVLSNPDEESLLKDKVDFILKRKEADGTWAITEPD
ncbi:MAG: caspase family protein, partial [Candidatus Methanoperedens sp.]|nr:caspase family protein [Candidatus Methanoperedens sp.]